MILCLCSKTRKLKTWCAILAYRKEKIEKMESKYDKQFHIVFQALKQMENKKFDYVEKNRNRPH